MKSETVKNIVTIAVVVLMLIAQLFFGIKVNDISIDLEDMKAKIIETTVMELK